jgi:hypothetical protein
MDIVSAFLIKQKEWKKCETENEESIISGEKTCDNKISM